MKNLALIIAIVAVLMSTIFFIEGRRETLSAQQSVMLATTYTLSYQELQDDGTWKVTVLKKVYEPKIGPGGVLCYKIALNTKFEQNYLASGEWRKAKWTKND